VQDQFQAVHSMTLNKSFLRLYLAFTNFWFYPSHWLLRKEGLVLWNIQRFRPIFDVSTNVKGAFILVTMDDLCAWIIHNEASGFRRAVLEIYTLLGYYPAYGGNSMESGSLSPRHGASSGCGWRNGLQYGFPVHVPQFFGKCQGILRKEGARPALPSGMAVSNRCLYFASILTLDFNNRVSNSRNPASQNNALPISPMRHAHWSLFCPRRHLQPWRETRWPKPFLVTVPRVCRWALRCGKTQECLN
jgi:hypothetical protein